MRSKRRNSHAGDHVVTTTNNNNNLPLHSHRKKVAEEASTSAAGEGRGASFRDTAESQSYTVAVGLGLDNEPKRKVSKRSTTGHHHRQVSSLGDEIKNSRLHKTKTKAIKKGKDKKMKKKQVKAVADSLNLRQQPLVDCKTVVNLRSGANSSQKPSKGKQKKNDNRKTTKNRKQRPKPKNTETVGKGKTIVKRIVQNVQNVLINKKNEPVQKKKNASPKKKLNRRRKANRSSTMSAVRGKVCVVEGFSKEASDNSWIDIDSTGNDDCKDGSHPTLQVPSATDECLHFNIGRDLLDSTDCSTSKVGVVDLASSKTKLFKKPRDVKSKKKAKMKLRFSGFAMSINDTSNLPLTLEESLKIGDSTDQIYLRTSTPKDLEGSGFFSVGKDTSAILNSRDTEPTAKKSTHKSPSRKRKIVDEEIPTSDKIPKNDALSEALNYKFYKLGNSSECLVVLHVGSVLAFYGKALIKVVYGHANILGHRLINLHEFTPVFSPESHSALSITTEKSKVNIVDLTNKLDAISFNPDEMKHEILNQLCLGNSCLIWIKKMEDGLTRYLSCFEEFADLFNTKLPKPYLQTSNVGIAFSIGLQLINSDKDSQTTFQPPPKYEEVCGTICRSSTDKTPVVITCGKKNVGKSTFCRYLINSLLRKCKQVYYLECDVGQTEFTPPGCVSLSQVSEPILGPPFCHQKQPEKMCYFGDVKVNDFPDRYILCIKHVLDYYQHSCADTSLVINTMGWTTDMGLMLLIDTIRMANPTHIVQFIPPIQSVPPPLEMEYISSAEGWSVKETDLGLSAQLLKLNVDGEQSTNQKYKASSMRTLALLSTLFDLQPKPLPVDPLALSGIVPVVVPWKDVAVCIPHYYVPRSQILYALNASIVGLCTLDSQQVAMATEDEEGYSLRILSSSPICECIGIGVIRGIDPVNEVFYILTPVAEQQLHNVNLLMGGTIPVPKQLLEQGQGDDVPYTKQHSTFRETGSAPLRPRKNLKRPNLRWKTKFGRK
ncbi:polynucleotide 5'-hydroxyl-kinase NOL9-like [Anneissia japonica]|uniref:polynucleotide 5'-hydroxyl-kinase NOL9-like n=1 Tax=Anneissia japonica TaxID=1529436 RepID=UPI0014258678|nr:polynucleotide 5'-hydroxyl-kinase NOL9-like [Anneissia japonica]